MMDRRQVLQGIGFGAAQLAMQRNGFGISDLPAPMVKTTGGLVQGYWVARNGSGKARTLGAGVRRIAAFKGIPYGADTRETRFQTPRRVGEWIGTKLCTEWGARAPQQSPDRAKPNPVNEGFNALQGAPLHYHLPPDEGVQSEDCLHVNVWSPGLDQKQRAVLFYIHGGAYNNGTVNAALYDGTRLAERGDVVVVTVNHRLNAFGYLYLGGVPALGAEYQTSGNVGMMDLVLALQWVRENVAAFGGDPQRVTIFGQSGGGAKCATLMAMESASGLFQRVWTMSGQQVWAVGKAKATANAKAALAAMGISGDPSAAALEALSVEQIQAGARTTGNWLPVRDEVVLKRDPFEPDSPPFSNSVPMVLGNTKDEIMGSTAWRLKDLTWDALPDELGKQLAPFKGSYTVEEIIKAYRRWYPAYTPVEVYVAAVAAFRSWPGQVIEAERRASNAVAATRTWVYQMNFPSPTADGRAPHTIDIAFVFDNLRLSPGMVGDAEEDVAAAQPLATQMSDRLVEFAETGLPGKGWPVYGLADRDTMIFDRLSKVVRDPRGEERRMMVGAKYRQPGT